MNDKEIYAQKILMLITEAEKWIGVSEHGGDNHGPEVEMFQRAVDGKAQGESWCLAFVQFCVKKVDSDFEVENGGVNPPTWLFSTEHVMTLWNKSPLEARLKEVPHPGCLVIWQYYESGKATTKGHVGIVTDVIDGEFVSTVEGNTGPSSDVQREGDGVYLKHRRIAGGSSMKVKGFLRCWKP